jgi:hypothetical protein
VSRHRLISRRRAVLWIAVNSAILVAATSWVVVVAFGSSPVPGSAPAVSQSAPVPGAPPTQAPVPDRNAFLKPAGTHFGINTPQAPWSSAELETVSTQAGTPPTLIEFFVKWNEDFRPEAVAMCYRQRALPLLSWEPWAGVKAGQSQPAYALRRIIRGQYDDYLTRFATAVRDQRWPVAIRFAHEMNGDWYPWSEKRSGNRKGEYVRAWRHVHDVFTKVGATNVIWVWSPNIVRPVPKVGLRELYPGDAYTDWVGMVGYAVYERTAAQVFDPTLRLIRKFTDKPVLITETGASPGPKKAGWTANFFGWLRQHRDVVGFVWFQTTPASGATGDWRFTTDPATQKAFRDGLKQSTLAPPLDGYPPA